MYILVTGLPGSGKTTLASTLASTLRLPLLSKDTVKERLFDVMGVRDRAWSLVLGVAANEVLWAVAADCFSGAVIETWLDPTRGDDERARQSIRGAGVEITWEVMCDCAADLAAARYAARQDRHVGHMSADAETLKRIHRAASLLAPLGVAPLLRLDTSQPVNVDWLVKTLTDSVPGSPERRLLDPRLSAARDHKDRTADTVNIPN